MTGYELLGMAMRGEIAYGEKYKRNDVIDSKIVIVYKKTKSFESEMHCIGLNIFGCEPIHWNVRNLKSDWYKVEQKPQLDEWEKEVCEKAIAEGFTKITGECGSILFNMGGNKWRWVLQGFDFVKDDMEYDLEWLLEG